MACPCYALRFKCIRCYHLSLMCDLPWVLSSWVEIATQQRCGFNVMPFACCCAAHMYGLCSELCQLEYVCNCCLPADQNGHFVCAGLQLCGFCIAVVLQAMRIIIVQTAYFMPKHFSARKPIVIQVNPTLARQLCSNPVKARVQPSHTAATALD